MRITRLDRNLQINDYRLSQGSRNLAVLGPIVVEVISGDYLSLYSTYQFIAPC